MDRKIVITLDQARKFWGLSENLNRKLLETFTEEELTQKEFPKTWEELKETVDLSGFYIAWNGKLVYDNCENIINDSIHVFDNNFKTRKQAESAFVSAKLSQLMHVYNGDWVPEWNVSTIRNENIKYCICRYGNEIVPKEYQTRWSYLAFKTADIRDEFMKNFKDLIKIYYMLD